MTLFFLITIKMTNPKKIVIVGGTGFFGYHLSKKCIKKKWTVISLSRKKPKKIRLIKNVKYKLVNILDINHLSKVIKKIHKVDYVVNFGGEVNHKKRKETLQTHHIGTINISNLFLKKKIKKFIQVGSSMEYGRSHSPQHENINVKPISNYGKAKAYATKHVLNLYKNYLFPAIVVRPYQVYGTHQDINRFIPFIIKNCIKDNKFPCSNGKQYRDFLYIEDFINFIIKCLTAKNVNGLIFNVGAGKPKKILNIINLIKNKCKLGSPLLGKIKLRKDENLTTYPSIKKAFKFLNWKPKTSLEIGLNKTISYYKKPYLL